MDSLNWFNSELNGCIAFKEASELLLPRVEKRLMITDGGGCWSYLGSIQTPEEGQRISISDGCYGKRVEYRLYYIVHRVKSLTISGWALTTVDTR